MRPLLVGEANPYGGDPRAALWPSPVNSSGWRLCSKILGLTPYHYLRKFRRVNTCPESSWNDTLAHANAQTIRRGQQAPLILLGKKVCDAFDMPYRPFSMQGSLLGPERRIFVLPHPSGRCFAWNDADNVQAVRFLLEEFL